ncbi:hypothetical protein CAEBREN_14019 [Caenorhabditis brenneri]|uniref:histone acetyltransferase n=1 Tax=Caenorhabditis brenneri TaxID=135651 RepID=G0NE11_CAEBE|nr:hypothetical protein CAEBREN_14019 [Caenorhabditis brenneri]
MNKNRKQKTRPAPRNSVVDDASPQQGNGTQDAPQQAQRVQDQQQNVPVVAAPRPMRQMKRPEWYQAKHKMNNHNRKPSIVKRKKQNYMRGKTIRARGKTSRASLRKKSSVSEVRKSSAKSALKKGGNKQNQRPGPSTQVLQSRNTGEDQENQEVDQDDDQRVSIKKNKRGTKRQRETTVDVDTDGFGNPDAVANSEAAPGPSQAAIGGGAPRNKVARMEQDGSDNQIEKRLEFQQTMNEQRESQQREQERMRELERQQKEKKQNEKPLEHQLKTEEQKNKQLEQQEKEKVKKMKKQLEQQREQRRENEERNEELLAQNLEMEEKKNKLQEKQRETEKHLKVGESAEQGLEQDELDKEDQEQQQKNEKMNKPDELQQDHGQKVQKHQQVNEKQQQMEVNLAEEDSPVPPSNEELAIAVEEDDLVIETISKKEQQALLEKAKKFIDDEMEKTLASNESNKAKRVSSALRQVAKVLNQKAYLSSPLSAYDDAIRIFTSNMSKCEHRVDEESALYSICDQFLNIMTSAFCCKRFLVATSVKQQCNGHETTCWIKDGDRCYKNGEKYYCMTWFEEKNSQTSRMKKVIYRHFQPEKYETCTTCDTVWHPKCRLTRLLKDEDSLPCRNHNDMLHIKQFSKQFKETPLQKALSKNYHKNRGTLPELQFVHAICETVTPGEELEKVKVKPEDYTHEANQIFVIVMIKNVETLIFALNTQEYRSGPKKGWVVIEYLDSLSILTKDRSAIYKRIIRSYLKYARDSGFKIAHLWSCAPDNGVDYIFSGHPKSQRFLRKDQLDEWYLSIFQECDGEFGKVDVGYAKKYFDEVLKKTTVEEMCNSLVVANGFWTKEIEEIIKKMKENKNDSLENFKQEIQKIKDASINSLFYVELANGDEGKETNLETKKTEECEEFSNKVTGNRDKFLDEQCSYDIEFTDLRQAQFATRKILMEVFLARGGVENLPRNAPKPFSFFSRGAHQLKWTHP